MTEEQEEIRKFWEWCGVAKIKRGWKFPNGDVLIDVDPPITLDNLFKYAVPKLNSMELTYQTPDRYTALARQHTEKWFSDKDPAQALYQAIREVMKNG